MLSLSITTTKPNKHKLKSQKLDDEVEGNTCIGIDTSFRRENKAKNPTTRLMHIHP
jgi:hypothetical protein